MQTRRAPNIKKELLDYLRLELAEDDAQVLCNGSLIYLGAEPEGSSDTHYWSYPTANGVDWVALDADHSIGTCDDGVPDRIKLATPAREAHRMRKPRPAAIPLDRSQPTTPAWVPWRKAIANYYPVWHETEISFEFALRRLKAKDMRDGDTRLFCLHLTSGRYARLACNDRFPAIEISLELFGGNERSIGHVYLADMVELYTHLGLTFKQPKQQFPYDWR